MATYNLTGIINQDSLMFNFTNVSRNIPDIKILGVDSIQGPNYTNRLKSNGFVGLAPYTFVEQKVNGTDTTEEVSVSILSDLLNKKLIEHHVFSLYITQHNNSDKNNIKMGSCDSQAYTGNLRVFRTIDSKSWTLRSSKFWINTEKIEFDRPL